MHYMLDSLSVMRFILPIYGTDQDDSRTSSTRELLAALQNAGLPLLIDRDRAYFIGGREFEIILAPDDHDDELWIAVHALQTRYRKKG